MDPKRITYRGYFADILRDRRCATPRWTYIVQREGEAEILSMGTCDSIEDCIRDAKQAMRELAHPEKKRVSAD